MAASLIFGLAPAWRASRPALSAVLGDGARGSMAPGRRRLVVGQGLEQVIHPPHQPVEPLLDLLDSVVEIHELPGEPHHLGTRGDAQGREGDFGGLVRDLLHRGLERQPLFQILPQGLGEGLGSHGLLQHFGPRRDPLVQELLPLGHQVGGDRPLREELGPGGHSLVHERAPEGGGVRRLALTHQLGPGLGPFLDLLLPEVEERLSAWILGHERISSRTATKPPDTVCRREGARPPPGREGHKGPPYGTSPGYERGASQAATLGQQWVEAPRPAIREI